MNSKDIRAALLVAKRATGGAVTRSDRLLNRENFLEGTRKVPRVLYHGTKHDFTKTLPWTHFGTREASNHALGYRYEDFTSPEDLNFYAEQRMDHKIIPVHMSMKNPLDLGDEHNYTPEYKNPQYRHRNFYIAPVDPVFHAAHVLENTPGKEWAGLKLRDMASIIHKESMEEDNPDGYSYNYKQLQHPMMAAAAKLINQAGYDGLKYRNMVEDKGATSYIALSPNQVKSAIGNSGEFDRNSPDMMFAAGGAVTDNDNFKSWFGNSVTHTNGVPHVFYTGTSKDKDFNSFNVSRHGAWFTQDPNVASMYAETNDSQGHKQDGWKFTPTNTASRVIPAYIKAENPFTGEIPQHIRKIPNYKRAQSDWFDKLRAQGYDSWIPGSGGGKVAVVLKDPQQIKSLYNSGSFDPKQKHMSKATGGALTGELPDTPQRNLNSVGLYSKAAMKIIQQHDPYIKPEKIKGSDGVERFGFSFTPRAKRSIMKGQPAFSRGGKVEPTDAQKSAGNYKKKHINFQGLPISIENEKGSTRSGQDEKGNKWSVKMPADYGYVKRTEGADGDHVDVYVGPDESSSNVFVIDQKDHRTGKFDEHKVMLGFDSLRSAIQSYTNGFSDGKAHLRLGNVARLSMKEFKQWLSHHDTKKPIRNQSAIDKALSVAKSAQGAKNGI